MLEQEWALISMPQVLMRVSEVVWGMAGGGSVVLMGRCLSFIGACNVACSSAAPDFPPGRRDVAVAYTAGADIG